MKDLSGFLAALVDTGQVSVAAAVVGERGRMLDGGVAGLARAEPPRSVGAGALFDLASLTKPITATLALTLHRAGLVSLELPVREVWSRAAEPLARACLEDLLRHRAGLRPWWPLYALSREQVEPFLISGEAVGAPPGTYSDLGYILWGLAAESVMGASLATLFRMHLLGPLGLRGIAVRPDTGGAVAECQLDGSREEELALELGVRVPPPPPPRPGEVQDGNARFLGGLAGHAGLFGTARAVWRLACEWLEPGRLFGADLAARALAGEGPDALGWRRRAPAGNAAQGLAEGSYGHNGFTGGSLWIDPVRRRIFVLLAHRRDPTFDLAPWRARFHLLAGGR